MVSMKFTSHKEKRNAKFPAFNLASVATRVLILMAVQIARQSKSAGKLQDQTPSGPTFSLLKFQQIIIGLKRRTSPCLEYKHN